MHGETERERLEEAAAFHPSTCSAWSLSLSLSLTHTISLSFPCVGEQLCSSSSHFELYRSVGAGLYAVVIL